MQGFPKQEHQIDTITRKPERLAIDLLVEDIIENAATITTLKGGGLFGHTATCMSDAQYATIQNSIPFILAPPPGVLTFSAGIPKQQGKMQNSSSTTMSLTLNWNRHLRCNYRYLVDATNHTCH